MDCFGTPPETRATLITAAIVAPVVVTFCTFAVLSGISDRKIDVWKSARALALTLFTLAAPCTFFTVYIWSIVRNHNQGKVSRIYPLTVDGELRFSVWLTRVYSKKVGADYAHILRTYDVESGTELATVRVSPRHYDEDFRIYPPAGNRAWAYGHKDGLKLLDLAEAQVIADEDALLERMSVFGGSISFTPSGDPHDPTTNSVLVRAADGSQFRVNDTLGVVAAPRGSGYNTPGRQDRPWEFVQARGSMGYLIRNLESNRASTEPELLHPEFIEELNTHSGASDRIWVAHKSTHFGDFVWLATCFDSTGRDLNTISLGQVSGSADVVPIAVVTRKEEMLLLISQLAKTHVTREPVTLVGLKTDPKTAEIRGCIRYF
jgi:hypothetical protein